MVIQPLTGNPYSGYINPYYWVDDHPLLYGNIGSLDPSIYHKIYYPIIGPEPPNLIGFTFDLRNKSIPFSEEQQIWAIYEINP